MLVVLDDVDEKFKFEDIYGSPQGFHSESRFIITSRNRNVLSTLIENQSKLHEVGSLSPSHSLELFCKHAFRNNSLPPGYKSLADDIVKTTEGLPLTLKGSSRVKAICVASSSNVEYELKSEYFANLFELRYFHAKSTGMLTGDFNDLLPNLRWLQLEHYNFDGEDGPPLTNFIMKKLVVFVLEICYITDDWGGWKHMKVLSMIRMKENDIQEVGIGNLKKLKKLDLAGSPLPRDLLLPASITSLRMKKCQSMDGDGGGGGGGYLDGLQGMRSLQNLLIQQVNGLTRIKGLTNLLCSSTCKLQTLCIIACDDLTELLPSEVQVLETTPSTLETLIIFFCPELEIGPIIRCLSKFPMLNRLMLGHVKISNEEDLEGLGTLEELVYLKLWLSSSLERLPSLSRLQKLRKLQVLAPGLHKIEGLGELKCLQSLKLRQCASLERLWPDENQQQLVTGDKLVLLDIRNCNSLSADHLSALKTTLPPAVNILWPDEPYTDSDEARTENEDDESVSDDSHEDMDY
ncbi:Disease resistance protein L6 [Linum grandiflorum]